MGIGTTIIIDSTFTHNFVVFSRVLYICISSSSHHPIIMYIHGSFYIHVLLCEVGWTWIGHKNGQNSRRNTKSKK